MFNFDRLRALAKKQGMTITHLCNIVGKKNSRLAGVHLYAGLVALSINQDLPWDTRTEDASKGMVAWGRENAAASGLADKPVRWIVDDCAKFVAREIRRGVRYDGIIMDPPSYGRGPGGEVWKLEDSIYDFIDLCAGVLSGEPLFVAVNSYTTGLSPSVMEYMLRARVCPRWGGHTACDEIGLPVTATGGVVPCGATAWWLARNAGL